jgi:hypothetical protein
VSILFLIAIVVVVWQVLQAQRRRLGADRTDQLQAELEQLEQLERQIAAPATADVAPTTPPSFTQSPSTPFVASDVAKQRPISAPTLLDVARSERVEARRTTSQTAAPAPAKSAKRLSPAPASSDPMAWLARGHGLCSPFPHTHDD